MEENKMIKKATSGLLVMLLLIGFFVYSWPSAKAQTATPSQGVITVSGVPASTNGLAVEVTVDTAVVTLGSGSSSVSGGLVVVGSMSEGVGIISTGGALPDNFTITVPFTGVAEGTSMVSVGQVLDMLGGTAIAGASASVDVSSVTVGAGGGPTSTSSTTGGPGGQLSADTFTVTIDGESVATTNALNVTVTFSDPSVVSLDTGVTFMGTGATQLLTDVNVTTGVLTVVWDGTITDNRAVLTGMLKAGSTAGTSTITVGKVEASGGNDISGAVAVTVDPDEVTNSSTTGPGPGGATFELFGPNAVTGPGKAAFAIKVTGGSGSLSATVNGKAVDFIGSDAGVVVLDLPSSGSLDLTLTSGGTDVDLGSVTVNAGSGKAPSIKRANATNKKKSSKLVVNGKNLKGASATVIPAASDRTATKTNNKKANAFVAKFPADECVPNGSYVNVSTAGGADAKKIKVKGSCAHPLIE